MTRYQQPYWGYELDIPDGWIHQTIKDSEAFARNKAALNPGYEGLQMGHILIRGEWNSLNKDIELLWNQYIARTSIMLGAKNLGSSPWSLPSGQGFEAEIQLPKKTDRRLWVGILENRARILHFMVVHSREERTTFEPQATRLISSIRFLQQIDSVEMDKTDLPLPFQFNQVDPTTILADISDPGAWKAYAGPTTVGALRAFYNRELPVHGWSIHEYIPYPSTSDLGFARLTISREGTILTLGLMPHTENAEKAVIVIKKNE